MFISGASCDVIFFLTFTIDFVSPLWLVWKTRSNLEKVPFAILSDVDMLLVSALNCDWMW